ncbi:TPA_asm: coat protein [ssRNA phage SRR7976326_1]|uniref:Coat protein n=1 Tax=ssRNA phage SRR7976326_1 TaxID=2786725 RepID=A0A8S5L520_9VIRU|nr:coat protein [ssRNA phage SRR7976326_1]DAD52798.1 TPA_asm: coat protein [ssRNA phage SRR7976326_1]
MAVSLSSPITGGAQTGLTAPTYTIAADSAPTNAKQWTVTALGGTQTGVTVHSISAPFTLTYWRPMMYKLVQWVANAVGVQPKSIPRNVHKFIVRKSVNLSATVSSTLVASVEISVPASAETYDPANCRAAMSALIGALNQQSAGWGDTLVSGTL